MNSTLPIKPLDGRGPQAAKKAKTPSVRKKCYTCRLEETATKPFVRCACTRSWHITCSSPNVELIPVGSVLMYKLKGGSELYKDFVCKRCKHEGRNASTSMGTCSTPSCGKAAQPSQNAGLLFCQEHEPRDKVVEVQKQKLQDGDLKTCEYPLCTTPIDIFKMNSSASFCPKHKTEMLFQKAQNAAKAPTQPPPEVRPFKKAKLYPFNDEGKAILKEQRANELHKGKRPRFRKSVSFQTDPEEKSMCKPEISSSRDPKQANKPFEVSASTVQGFDSTSSPNIVSRSATADNPARFIANSSSVHLEANVDLPSNANAITPIISKPIDRASSPAVTSPEAEEDNPDSQLAQEILATMPPVEFPRLGQQPDFRASMGSLSEPTDVAMTCDQSIEFANEFLMAASDNDNYDNEDDEDSDNDIRYAFLVPPTNITGNTVMKDTSSNNEPRFGNPVSTTPISIEIVAADEGRTVDMPLPVNSLELVRAQKAAKFDCSELDSWLAKEPTIPLLDIQPSAKELLETQQWGHVDPRKAWPPVFSEQWLEDKKAEIRARGGRKANYGKIITAQNRKEREAKGWNIHQSEESKVLTDERREIRRKVEELFDVKDVDDMVPRVDNNGVLFMVDVVERQGKGKKAARIYQVG